MEDGNVIDMNSEAEMKTATEKIKGLFSQRNLIVVVVLLVFLVLYLLFAGKGSVGAGSITSPDGEVVTASELRTVQDGVAKLLEIPPEIPLVKRLKGGEYTDVVAGDYLLIYPVGKQAVVYSVEREELVNVGYIQFSK